MEEYLQVFDENHNMLNESIKRSEKFNVEKNKYFMIILLIIENDKHEFLVQKTSKEKGSVYAFTGGHVTAGDDNVKTVIKEVKEELGIDITEDEFEFVDSIRHHIAFADTFYMKKNIDLKDIKLQDEEVEGAYWMTKEEIYKLDKEEKFRHKNMANFEKVLEYIKDK